MQNSNFYKIFWVNTDTGSLPVSDEVDFKRTLKHFTKILDFVFVCYGHLAILVSLRAVDYVVCISVCKTRSFNT